MPLVDTTYQTLLRMSLDGSTVLSSTLLAPGTQSFITPYPSGVWANGSFSTPLLPLTPLSTIGNGYSLHLTAQNVIDQSARFGGIAATSPTPAPPSVFTSLTTDPPANPSSPEASPPPPVATFSPARPLMPHSPTPPRPSSPPLFTTLSPLQAPAAEASAPAPRPIWPN